MAGSSVHPFANPGPAGLMVLAFYLGCLWPIATHQAPHELAVVLVPLGLAGGIIQLTAGIIELKNGNAMVGNILLAFSTFMFLGMGENLLKALEIMPQNTMAVDGWIFLIMGILMCGFTIGHLPGPLAPLLFMVATDLFFVPAGLYFLTGAEFLWMIAGWDLPFVVISIIWVVMGTILNPIFGRNLVPLGPSLLRLSGDERPVAAGDAE